MYNAVIGPVLMQRHAQVPGYVCSSNVLPYGNARLLLRNDCLYKQVYFKSRLY